MSLKLNKNELSRWKNYSWGHDGDLAKNQKFLTALQKQNHLKVVIRELNEEIVQTIDKFSGLNQKILKLKYIDGLTLEAIANETGYTHQYIKNKHAELMRIIKFDRS
jgi:DNA-directed RNA polymerase specialized sigma subunit